MLRLLLALTLATTSLWAHARYSELDPRTSEEILLDTYIFDTNTKVIEDSSVPQRVLAMVNSLSLVSELGDDKFKKLKSSYYAVYDSAEEIVGYIYAELLAGPVDGEYVLAWVHFTPRGQRLGSTVEFEGLVEDDLYTLPSELLIVNASDN